MATLLEPPGLASLLSRVGRSPQFSSPHASKPSGSDAASAAPARAHLVGGRAHAASAAVAAAAMHQSPRQMPVLDPPLLLGPPPPVGRRQQQHGNVDWSCACVVSCCGVWDRTGGYEKMTVLHNK